MSTAAVTVQCVYKYALKLSYETGHNKDLTIMSGIGIVKKIKIKDRHKKEQHG